MTVEPKVNSFDLQMKIFLWTWYNGKYRALVCLFVFKEKQI